MSEDLIVKGIILKTSQYGEYGRRIVILTDKFGKITAFAGGASKASSKIIGLTRPMVCARFNLMKGRGGWNLHGVELIDSFEELAFDIDKSLLSMYILEYAEYFAQDGMIAEEAKSILNLIYVTLNAIRSGDKRLDFIRRIYELKLLVIEGEAPELPPYSDNEALISLWKYVIASSLSRLYTFSDEIEDTVLNLFVNEVNAFVNRQIPHRFKVLDVLREL
ncbi:MAG: DNA repair protein RecO [Eubacteriales bacterium]|nr:DNA repair protein RecO [Eubacteriales bacterium]